MPHAPLRIKDLPRKVQQDIVAGTVREEIADFEHRHRLRPKPQEFYTAQPYAKVELARQEVAKKQRGTKS